MNHVETTINETFRTIIRSRENETKLVVKMMFLVDEKYILCLFHNKYRNFLKEFCGVNLGLVYLKTK